METFPSFTSLTAHISPLFSSHCTYMHSAHHSHLTSHNTYTHHHKISHLTFLSYIPLPLYRESVSSPLSSGFSPSYTVGDVFCDIHPSSSDGDGRGSILVNIFHPHCMVPCPVFLLPACCLPPSLPASLPAHLSSLLTCSHPSSQGHRHGGMPFALPACTFLHCMPALPPATNFPTTTASFVAAMRLMLLACKYIDVNFHFLCLIPQACLEGNASTHTRLPALAISKHGISVPLPASL